METLEIVPLVEKLALEIFEVEDENDAKIRFDGGSIVIHAPIKGGISGATVRIGVDAGDDETYINIAARGEGEHEYVTRIFTDTLTPELLERYLRQAHAELVYDLKFEIKVAERKQK